MPLLHKAVRLILVGFKMESVPKGHSVCSMLNCDTFICRPHETAMLEQGLERCELDWAVAAGGFKVAYQLAVTQYDMLVAAYELSQEPDPENPVNAGANDTYPANMNIQECYAMALFGLGDPALAINHLGQGMYIYLQACKAKPDKNIEELMLWSADRIMELISLLQSAQGEYMWRYVKDRLTASLLMLGHAWPLSEALDNHPLVSSIDQLHKACHKLVNKQDTDTETKSSGSDPPGSAETTEADNKDKPKGLRCAKCNQKIPQDVPKAEISCGKCHASFYCSKHCRTKDALSHKAVCMRNKLRLKLALKASQLND
ncbi:TPA: hypothetical protein ACH3X3_011214 [Trebouxia sp. C0006]